MTVGRLRRYLSRLGYRYERDARTLKRLFPGDDYEQRGDPAIETRRNLETAVAEINGLLALSDEGLLKLHANGESAREEKK